MTTTETPREAAKWQDGVPANDRAAMADALEWLIAFDRIAWKQVPGDNRERLARCIADLKERTGRKP